MKIEHPKTGEFIEWLFCLGKVIANKDDIARPVYVTPYDGCYGNAGYVVVVNGSPPKATFLIEPTSGYAFGRVFDSRFQWHRYPSERGAKHYKTLAKWLKEFGIERADRAY